MQRIFRAGIAVLLLSACAGPRNAPGGAEARSNAATVAACRQRADAIYEMRHRDTIYRGDSGVNTPFSANYQPGVPDRGLSQLYEHDSEISDCVRNTGAEGDRTPTHSTTPPQIIMRP